MNKEDVFKVVEDAAWSMSDFQARYFVVHSQVTPYRRVRQALLELETRIAARKQIERNMKKTSIELKIKERDLQNETDELKKELILVDIDQLQYDMSVYKKKLKVVFEELDIFAGIVQQLVPDIPTLETYKVHDEKQERQYWITRMGKQAAMDMMTSGKIGSGNLDSIAMMTMEDQIATIKTAITYTAHLNSGIKDLEQDVLNTLNESKTTPSFMALETAAKLFENKGIKQIGENI